MKQVVATARGYYGALREPGDVFMVADDAFKIGATWFEGVNSKDAPANVGGAVVGSPAPTLDDLANAGIPGTPGEVGDVVSANLNNTVVTNADGSATVPATGAQIPAPTDNGTVQGQTTTTLKGPAATSTPATTKATGTQSQKAAGSDLT